MFTYLIGREKSATDQPLKKISGDYYGKKIVEAFMDLQTRYFASGTSFVHLCSLLFVHEVHCYTLGTRVFANAALVL